MEVFVLYFMGPDPNGHPFGKFLGVYSSQSRAARAVERLQGLPAFRHYPKGFQVEVVRLDGDFDPTRSSCIDRLHGLVPQSQACPPPGCTGVRTGRCSNTME